MPDFDDRFVSLCMHPDLGAAMEDGRPVFAVDPATGRLVWGNGAAGRFFEAPSFADLTRPPIAAERTTLQQLVQIARTLVPGAAATEKLRFPLAANPGSVSCHCLLASAGTPSIPVLFVTILDASVPYTGARESLAQFVRLLAAPRGAAEIVQGGMVIATSDRLRATGGEPVLAKDASPVAVQLSSGPAELYVVKPAEAAVAVPVAAPAAGLFVPPAAVAAPAAAAAAVPVPAFDPVPPRSTRLVFTLDAAYRFIMLQGAARDFLGVDPNALIGKSLLDMASDGRFEPTGALAAALQDHKPFQDMKINWPHADGRQRVPAEMTLMPVFSAPGVFEGLRGFLLLIGARAFVPAPAIDLAELSSPAFERATLLQPAAPQVLPAAAGLSEKGAELVDFVKALVGQHDPAAGAQSQIDLQHKVMDLIHAPAPLAADAAAPAPAPAHGIVPAALPTDAHYRATLGEPPSYLQPLAPQVVPAAIAPAPAESVPVAPAPAAAMPAHPVIDIASIVSSVIEQAPPAVAPLPATAGLAVQAEEPPVLESVFGIRVHPAALAETVIQTVEHAVLPQLEGLAAAHAETLVQTPDHAVLPAGPALAATEVAPEVLPATAAPAAEALVPHDAVAAPDAEITRMPVVARPTAWSTEHLDVPALSKPEVDAFRQIAEALGARFEGGDQWPHGPAAPVAATISPSAATLAGAAAAAGDVMWRENSGQGAAGLPREAALIDKIPLALLLTREGEAVFANKSFLDLTGHPDLGSFRAQGGLSSLFSSFPSNGESGQPQLLHQNGHSFPAQVNMVPVPLSDGTASMVILRDTSQLATLPPGDSGIDPATLPARSKAAEARVRELEGAMRVAADGVLMLDMHGVILDANLAAGQLFGAQHDALVGRPLQALFADAAKPEITTRLAAVADMSSDSQPQATAAEVWARKADGTDFPVAVGIGRASADKLAAAIRDLSFHKSHEASLLAAKQTAEDANKQKTDFLAKISHEVRTPLNAIIGFSEVMMEERFGPVGNDRYRQYLRDIHNSGSHIMSLVNDLLDISKIEAGKLDIDFREADLNTIVRECVGLVQPQANRERIVLRIGLASSAPHVLADLRTMRQIVLNLLSNAVKFTRPGGQVIISTQMEDTGDAAIRVRDTGIGMSPAEIKRAMEPFSQIDSSRPGTGLGLPLTKALIEANKAEFRLDSVVNTGTLAQVVFPRDRVVPGL